MPLARGAGGRTGSVDDGARRAVAATADSCDASGVRARLGAGARSRASRSYGSSRTPGRCAVASQLCVRGDDVQVLPRGLQREVPPERGEVPACQPPHASLRGRPLGVAHSLVHPCHYASASVRRCAMRWPRRRADVSGRTIRWQVCGNATGGRRERSMHAVPDVSYLSGSKMHERSTGVVGRGEPARQRYSRKPAAWSLKATPGGNGSFTRSGCRMRARMRTPSTRRGPGRL